MAASHDPKVRILDDHEIAAALQRMAWEVYEANYSEQELSIAGIGERGMQIANYLANRLREISKLKVETLALAKQEQQPKVRLEGSALPAKGSPVLIVDDVLYSGRTLFDAVSLFLEGEPKSIKTLVLIDRGHRSLPIRPDFLGMDLATTLKQHVSVEIDSTGYAQAFLQ